MRRRGPRLILIFGEDDNDRKAIRELLGALRPDLPAAKLLRRPTVLIKDAALAKARSNAQGIAGVVRAAETRSTVLKVLAHQDCDACEPDHLETAERIEGELARASVDAIAVTPAWEIEAWWFLWPEAVVAVHPSWRLPIPSRQQVGRIRNAKEELRRAVRPRASRGRRGRGYVESDSPRIAAKVRELGLIHELKADSGSFREFRSKVEKIPR